jgi:hypothetical protein
MRVVQASAEDLIVNDDRFILDKQAIVGRIIIETVRMNCGGRSSGG